MENKLKYIRYVVIISLLFLSVYILFGIAILVSGSIYTEVDTEKIELMIAEISESSEQNEQIDAFLEEMKKIPTRKGHLLMLISGVIVLAIGLHISIPLIIIFLLTNKKSEDDQNKLAEKGEERSRETRIPDTGEDF